MAHPIPVAAGGAGGVGGGSTGGAGGNGSRLNGAAASSGGSGDSGGIVIPGGAGGLDPSRVTSSTITVSAPVTGAPGDPGEAGTLSIDGGSGGGGGALCYWILDSTITNQSVITGGNGGTGGDGGNAGGGGGGGGGGDVVYFIGFGGFSNESSSVVRGGDGGTGGSGGNSGDGGGGGDGLNGSRSMSFTISNAGTISGGNGGSGGTISGNGGSGGSGISDTNSGVYIIVNAGTISGGNGGNGVNGGGGGDGISDSAPMAASFTITNNGTIIGGAGGDSWIWGVNGGNGGSGISGSWLTNWLTIINAGTISGGVGGNGVNGGNGGSGVSGSGWSFTNHGTISGGNGGTGGSGGNSGGGNGGGGGDGISGSSFTIVNDGTISGGDGAIGGTIGSRGGDGGSGISGVNLYILNSGTISGGLGGAGAGAPGNAITFTDGENSLELRAGSVINGNVVGLSGSTNFLYLGGDTTDLSGNPGSTIFDVSRLASADSPAAQYQGFSWFYKFGSGTWALTGATTALTPWIISAGTLQIASDAALGDVAGAVTLDGGTLATTADIATSRNFTITGSGGTISTDAGTTYAIGGVLSDDGDSGGTLTKEGNGTLILTGTNTYTGGTTISGGTLQLGNGGASGSITGDVTNNGTLAFGRSDTYTFGGVISGSGAVNQIGSGTTTLTSANSYSGGTQVNAGTLALSGSGTLGATTGALTINGGTLDLGGTSQTVGSLSGTGGGITNSNAASSTLTVNQSANTSYAGAITDGIGTVALTKDGPGTLILTGTNSYTGGTVVNDGTLAGDTSSLQGNIENNANVEFDQNSNGTYAGNMNGSGNLFKEGAGTLTLSGTNTYGGATVVEAGTLQAGATNTFSPNSDVTVASGATLDLDGYNETIAGLRNAGTVSLRGAVPGTILTVSGDYERLGSQVLINTVLNDDSSPTDKMVVGGSITGNPGHATTLDVQNMGGTGKVTINGIQVIEVGGTSAADAFALAGGKPSIPVGNYEYVLQRGGAVTGGDSWYLVSAVNPNPPPVNPPESGKPSPPAPKPPDLQPIYRPGLTSYVAAQFLNAGQGFQQLFTLHQRVGEHRGLPEEKQTWARTSYFTSKEDGETRFGYDQDTMGLQIGQEIMVRRTEHATQRAALAFDYGYTDADFSDRIRPLVGLNEKTGEAEARVWAFEGYFTQIYDGGAYFDIVGQVAALRNEYVVFESDGGRYTANQNGWRTGISGEVGYPLWQSGKWTLEGQGQLAYQYANYGGFTDKATEVPDTGAHSLRGRLGTRLARKLVKKEQQSLEAYGVANVVADLIQPSGVNIDDNGDHVRISESYDPLYGEIGGGLQGYVTGKVSLFADFRYQHGFDADNNRHGYAVNAGLRVGF